MQYNQEPKIYTLQPTSYAFTFGFFISPFLLLLKSIIYK